MKLADRARGCGPVEGVTLQSGRKSRVPRNQPERSDFHTVVLVVNQREKELEGSTTRMLVKVSSNAYSVTN